MFHVRIMTSVRVKAYRNFVLLREIPMETSGFVTYDTHIRELLLSSSSVVVHSLQHSPPSDVHFVRTHIEAPLDVCNFLVGPACTDQLRHCSLKLIASTVLSCGRMKVHGRNAERSRRAKREKPCVWSVATLILFGAGTGPLSQ